MCERVTAMTQESGELVADDPPKMPTSLVEYASKVLGYELLPWQVEWLHARVQVQIAVLDHVTRSGARPQVFMAGIPRPTTED